MRQAFTLSPQGPAVGFGAETGAEDETLKPRAADVNTARRRFTQSVTW